MKKTSILLFPNGSITVPIPAGVKEEEVYELLDSILEIDRSIKTISDLIEEE